MVIGIISSFSQVGFKLSPKALIPDFKRMDPIKGLKNLVSKKSLVRLAMALVKLSIMVLVAYFAIRKDMEPLMELVSMEVDGIFNSATSLIFGLILKITIILLILALFDLMYQRWQFAKDQRMTKHEVKQETKQQQGDPLIKSRIKTVQRQMANKRMMKAVPEADVVVSNPTHYAVALKYDANKMNAPKVVAKGLDIIALKIMEIAREHNVPVVEDRILARILYNTVEIDGEVPPKLYQAVAKVLSYVYQLRNLVGK
jgi:FlhB-like protein